MSQSAEVITAVSALGCAIAIGFVMQSSEVAEQRYGSGELAAPSEAALVGTPALSGRSPYYSSARTLTPFNVKSITLTSAGVQPRRRDLADVLVKTAIDPASGPLDPKQEVCPVTVDAVAMPAAMVSYVLDAPCFPGARVTIGHEGLTFAERLSDEGRMNVLLPALASDARITASFASGLETEITASVDGVDQYDRVVVQWGGDNAIELHARETGAQFDEAGSILIGKTPMKPDALGGFLTVLGDPLLTDPLRAEVYSLPVGTEENQGTVRLTVEAEVTPDNCGRKIRAHALQVDAGMRVSSQDLVLSMPDCGAVGSILVLNNLVQNLTVASK